MDKDTLISNLESYSKKTIFLDDLKVIVNSRDYYVLVDTIQTLQECGILTPVSSSGLNGLNPSLYMKYHINPPIADYSSQLREIKALHHAIRIDKYLHSPEKYIEVRSLIYPLSEYLKVRSSELSEEMSENERAYAIWHDEKILDDPKNLAILNDVGVLPILNVYPTPEPFFKHQVTSKPNNVLVIENKDTWFSLRRLMLNSQGIVTLFNVPLECVIYGEGKKASRKSSRLQRYILTDTDFSGTVYYWGDLDYEGINIYLGVVKYNPSLHIEPLVLAYTKMLDSFTTMLETSLDVREYACKKPQSRPKNMDEFLKYFSKEYADRFIALLNDGLYIPQEIVNYPTLKACARY